MKSLLISLALASLAGCATQAPLVVERPPLVVPERPRLAVQDMPPNVTLKQELGYYRASLYQCTGYAKELKLLLRPAATQK